ncbi:MAG TPA: zinc-ribbon domain-containing protein [Candidatus Paceibacterota bacterium]
MGKYKKYTYEIIKNETENLGYKLINKEYIGIDKKYIVIDKYGYIYQPFIRDLLEGQIPERFYLTNPYTIQNIKLWLKLNNKPFELLSEEYNGNNKKLKWKCLKEDCEEVFESTWNKIVVGHSCHYCSGKKVGLSNCLAIKRPDIAKEWHPTLNGDLTPFKVSENSGKKVLWKCSLNHLHEWAATICDRNCKNSGCPYCAVLNNESKIATRVRDFCNNYFGENNIIEEYRIFTNPKTNRYLPYDIYLKHYNIFIEISGSQHYKVQGYHVKEAKRKGITPQEEFEYSQYKDKIKKEYAEQHGIFLEYDISKWTYEMIVEDIKNIINIQTKIVS